MNAVTPAWIDAALASSIPVAGDAELIAACIEYCRIERELQAAYAQIGEHDEEAQDVASAVARRMQEPLVERIVSLRATTAEGHLARARCTTVKMVPGGLVSRDDPNDVDEDRFRAAELRDLIAGQPMSRLHPDGALIATCEQHVLNLAACAERQKDEAKHWHGPDDEDPLLRAYWQTHDAICHTQATTVGGLVALARAMRAEAEQPNGNRDGAHIPPEWSLGLADELLAVLGGEEQEPRPNPDADLIAVCDQHVQNHTIMENHPDWPETAEAEERQPALLAYRATLAAIKAAQPVTAAGCMAIARAARAEAWNPMTREYMEDGSMAAPWGLKIILALAAMGDPAPAGAPT